jgi:hypothetical protein
MTEPIKHRTLADKLDELELDEIRGVEEDNMIIEPTPEMMKSISSKPLSPDEIEIFDWLRFNNGSTIGDISRYKKLDEKYIEDLLRLLIAKRWVYCVGEKYFIDERIYL